MNPKRSTEENRFWKTKPLLVGAGLGLLAGLLLLGWLILFRFCPLLTLLILPAMWALVCVGENHGWIVVPVVLVQWTFLGALAGLIVSHWGQMSRPRRMIVYLAAGLLGLGVSLWIGAYILDDGRTTLTTSEDQVYQGDLPGCGPVIFNFEWRDDFLKPVFSQQTGEDWHWQQQVQKDQLQAVLIAGETNVLGRLMVSNRPSGGFLHGQWLVQNGRAFQPVKFQAVAVLREKEHFYRYYDRLNLSVTETRKFPVFPAGWQMKSITRALDRDWWRERREAAASGPTGLNRAMRKVKSLFSGHACEPVNDWRTVRLWRVSDKFVVLETCIAQEGMPARSEEHQTWNFVGTNGGFRRFELAELFRPNTPWEQRLASFCNPRLQVSRTIEGKFNPIDRKELDQFAVLQTGLLIRFYPVMGDPDDTRSILIPWSYLQDLLNPRGGAGVTH